MIVTSGKLMDKSVSMFVVVDVLTVLLKHVGRRHPDGFIGRVQRQSEEIIVKLKIRNAPSL